MGPRRYFTTLTVKKIVLYSLVIAYVVAVSVVSFLEPFLAYECENERMRTIEYINPSYNDPPCRFTRVSYLLFLTPEECATGRRLTSSVVLGGVIGWERRQADRPAGIRTMGLVALGSCMFTLSSTYNFIKGPMTWDSSRISAAIPSGVGFLGMCLTHALTKTGTNQAQVRDCEWWLMMMKRERERELTSGKNLQGSRQGQAHRIVLPCGAWTDHCSILMALCSRRCGLWWGHVLSGLHECGFDACIAPLRTTGSRLR